MLQGFGKIGAAVLVGAGLLSAVGCSVDVYTPAPRGEVVVEDAGPDYGPPEPQYEEVPPPPYVDAVWIGGEWTWHDHHWYWAHGHYEHRPYGYHRWHPAYWHEGPHGYVRVEGHWE